ncbi:unnamed protein product, partial [Adineta steineri]
TSLEKAKEHLSTAPNETGENADRLAEQIAKAALNDDETKKE